MNPLLISKKVIKLALAALFTTVLLSGCAIGQITGLVMGGADSLMPAHLSAATVDVLLEKGYQLEQKPVCVGHGEDLSTYTCNGVTVAGQKVVTEAHSGAHSEADMKITVDGKPVFEGTMNEILMREYLGEK